MKLNKNLIGVFSLLLFFSVAVFAQEKKMTKDEWHAEIQRLTTEKASLTKEVGSIQIDVNNLKKNENSMQSYNDCMQELYKLVGATEADVDNFKQAVVELDGKINRKTGLKTDRQKDLNALKSNKISALPEFFNEVHSQMQAALDSWVVIPKEVNYTVVKGDCLWCIAQKTKFYGNGFAWPMIYKANRDKIRNPNLIYPKQVFSIPHLNNEQKAKYNKIKKNYKPAPTK